MENVRATKEYTSPLFSAIAHNIKKSFTFKDWWVLTACSTKLAPWRHYGVQDKAVPLLLVLFRSH